MGVGGLLRDFPGKVNDVGDSQGGSLPDESVLPPIPQSNTMGTVLLEKPPFEQEVKTKSQFGQDVGYNPDSYAT